jgi:hypothetical protein
MNRLTRTILRPSAVLLTLAMSLVACGGPAEAGDDDEGDAYGVSDDAVTAGSWAFVRRDVRKCMAPMCGGYFLSPVQKTTLKCADGVTRASCYVATLDLSALGLAGTALNASAPYQNQTGEKLIVRGTAKAAGTYGTFVVTEAHRAATAAAAGATFYVVKLANTETFNKINTTSTRIAHNFTIATTAGDATARFNAITELKTATGLVTAGTFKTLHARNTFTATTLFLKVPPAAAPAHACGTAETNTLAAATNTLLYMSESDYPFTTILRTDLGTGPATAATVRTLAGSALPANAAVNPETVDDFFSWIARPDSADMDDAEKADAAKYRALRTLLEQDLTDLRIFRAGTIQVQVYILGRTSCGELAGLQTVAIET